jgi:hypothetical protein
MEASHASDLRSTLGATRADLAATQSNLQRANAKLVAANSLAERRRDVLLQAKDVLGKVDPLLSSVDNIQSKAGALGSDGSTISGDAESFIGTVSSLVNYLINADPNYIDYTWVNNEIDAANGELYTIRADESVLGGGNTAYTNASAGFGSKADAFTQSVRRLQKQLNRAVGG